MFLTILVVTGISVPLMYFGDFGIILGIVILAVGLLFTVLFFSTVECNRASYLPCEDRRSPPMAAKVGIRF